MSGTYKNLNSLSLNMNRIHIVFICFSLPYMMYFRGILLGVFFTVQTELELSLFFCISNRIQSMKSTKHISNLYEEKKENNSNM